MVDPQSAAYGALGLYAVLVHVAVWDRHVRLQAERDSLSAAEADVAAEGGDG